VGGDAVRLPAERAGQHDRVAILRGERPVAGRLTGGEAGTAGREHLGLARGIGYQYPPRGLRRGLVVLTDAARGRVHTVDGGLEHTQKLWGALRPAIAQTDDL
jgi:hypothetical protein